MKHLIWRTGGEATVAAEIGGNALGDLAVGGAVDEEEVVGVGMDVDEARRDSEVRAIHSLSGFHRAVERADVKILPSLMPMSAGKAGWPVPSRMYPFVRRRSNKAKLRIRWLCL
jgi:hypothetical protein